MYHRILSQALPAQQRGNKSVLGMHRKSVLGIAVPAQDAYASPLLPHVTKGSWFGETKGK